MVPQLLYYVTTGPHYQLALFTTNYLVMDAALEKAVYDLSSRGLVQAARWAAEALQAMDDPATQGVVQNIPAKVLFAKTCFDNHEYDRCVHMLENCADPVGIFLREYSRYISGEKASEDKPFSAKPQKANPNYAKILENLKQLQDPFGKYLSAVVLRKQQQETRAIPLLLQSLVEYPYNWSAWQEFLACFKTLNDVETALEAAESADPYFEVFLAAFRIHYNQEFYEAEEKSQTDFAKLEQIFPNFAFLSGQQALVKMHNTNYDQAEKIFESILIKDPYRLEELDLFSNLLYVTEQPTKLSYVAQLASKTDRYRAESCCVVANYYSLRGEHEKAIDYYQRALISNPNYLSAWTLLGHEFVELKNTHAAIESYRTAVTINKRDFRAWYGLGQAYEVLDMVSYSHYYYQRALALRPGDTRIWSAMGNCYEHMHQPDEAIRMYQQALRICDGDSYLYYRLGVTYEAQGDLEQAYQNIKLCAYEQDDDQAVVKPQARLWLARHAVKQQKWSEAHDHALAVTEFPFTTGLEEDARAIVREALDQMRR